LVFDEILWAFSPLFEILWLALSKTAFSLPVHSSPGAAKTTET